jgi:hypothetical protein
MLDLTLGTTEVGTKLAAKKAAGMENTHDRRNPMENQDSSWAPKDNNGDSHISGNDIPYEPGTLEAKQAWMKIEQLAHSPAMIAKAKALGIDHPVGMYMGKPLVPGEAGPGQSDFQMLKDRLIYYDGYSPDVATKIAARVKYKLYP